MTFVVKFPSTVIDDPSGGGTVSWSSPAAAEVADSTGSIAVVGNSLTTHFLKATNFGFSLGSNTIIKGIEFLINAKVTSTGTIAVKEFDVRLMKAGVPIAANGAHFTYNINPGGFAVYLHGTTTDLWGVAWTAADINDPNFGFYIQLRNPATVTQTDTVEVDYLEAGVIYNTIYSEVGSGGAVLGGKSRTPFVEKASGGAVLSGNVAIVINPTAGGVVVGGTSVCHMSFFVRGADGIYFLPQSIQTLAGWTGPITAIQEGVDNEDGDSSYMRGVNPADYLFVNFGTLVGMRQLRQIALRISVSSESSGGSLIFGLFIGPTNVGHITVAPPVGSYGTFEFQSPSSSIVRDLPLMGYFFPMSGPAIRLTAAEILVTSTSVGGTSPNTDSIADTGGMKLGGSAIVSELVNAQGGITIGGSSSISVSYNHTDSSGVLIGGTVSVANFVPCLGGTIIGGGSSASSGMLISAGLVIGGTSRQTLIDFFYASGGVVNGGSAIKDDLHIFHTEGLGGVFVSGDNDAAIKDQSYLTSGHVVVGGTSGARLSFNLDLKLSWNARASIFKDIGLIWNVGQLPVFWYRVIGQGHDGTQCNLIADPCCQKYIVNIHARTPSELCQKLSALNLNMPIDSVQKFTRPAESSVLAADAAKGITHDCNQLVQVDVCQIPSCADLCIDVDVRMVIGFSIPLIQSDSFYSYDATGSVFVSGFAGTNGFRNVPNFQYTASGGVQVDGSSDILASFINSHGGSVLGGSAHLQSNRWTYVGGVWPYYIVQLGQTAESTSTL